MAIDEMPWPSGRPNAYQREDNHHGYSWEEQAFAEDAGGLMGGGSTWPPRSYACTFCRKEFRSAQALGGHMNIHRRDRARLRQGNPIDININPESNFASFDHIHPRYELISQEPYYAYHEGRPHPDLMYHNTTAFSPDNSVVRLPHNSQPIRSAPIPSQPITNFIPMISQPPSSFSSHASPSTLLSISLSNKNPYKPSPNLFSKGTQTLQGPFDRVSKGCSDSNGPAEANRWNKQTDFLFNKAGMRVETVEAVETLFPETKEYVDVLDVIKINRCSKSEILDNMEDLDLELRLGERPPAEKYRNGKFKRGA